MLERCGDLENLEAHGAARRLRFDRAPNPLTEQRLSNRGDDLVAPLTAAVLSALPDEQAGIASAVNNAAARLAQLFAGAALPAAAGLSAATAVGPGAFSDGYRTAMLIAAAISALGGLISWTTIRGVGAPAGASPSEREPRLHLVPPGS